MSSGSLPGQVPGIGLINGLASAEAALAAYETSNTANVDALVAKLAATEFNTETSGLDADATYAEKLDAIKADAAAATAAKAKTTNQLNADVLDATADLKTIKDSLTSADDKKLVADFDAAVAANAALTAPSTADVGAATGGLGGDAGFADALTAVKALTGLTGGSTTALASAEEVYGFYTAATTTDADRVKLDAALKADTYASTSSFKATAAADIAKNTAIANEESAKDLVDGNATTEDYSGAVSALANAKADLAEAQLADTNQAAADTIAKDQAAEVAKVTAVTEAITKFNAENEDKLELHDIAKSVVGTDTVKDTFYFAAKADGADYNFATKAFGAGDSIVLGSGYSFNNGALTAGDNTKLEFFLQKTDTGTQVVIESKIFGSDSVTADAHTGVATNPADAVTVINLVGVTAEHLSVANGVVSYV